MGLPSGPTVREHREGNSQSWSTASEAVSSGNNSKLLPTTPDLIFNELTIKNTCLLPVTLKNASAVASGCHILG